MIFESETLYQLPCTQLLRIFVSLEKISPSEIKKFENLPIPAQKYISYIEDYLKVPVTVVSVGPDRDQTVHK